MLFHAKTVLDSLLNSLDFVFPKRFWFPFIELHRIPDFNGVSESENAIPDSKDVDSRVNNHKSCEFWNRDIFTLRDHYSLLRSCLSIAHS